MCYHVYVIYSKSKDTYYVGSTGDLGRRLNEHNTHLTPNSAIINYQRIFQYL